MKISPDRPIELIYGKEIFRYDSLRSLSASLSIGADKVTEMIKRGKGCVHEMYVEFRIVGETEEERIARLDEVSGKKKKKKVVSERKPVGAKSIEVTFECGAKDRYESVSECIKILGVAGDTIRKNIREEREYKGMRFRYLDEK
ncbi:TPA: hypothetical protein ACGW7B_006005 [Bacillus nitratireducens]